MEHAEIKLGELRLKEKFNLDRKFKGFFKYTSIKRKTREYLGSSLNKTGKTHRTAKSPVRSVSQSLQERQGIGTLVGR